MHDASQEESPTSCGQPRPLFPLIRHLSTWATQSLLPLPVSPNHVTTLSLGFGLAATWFVYVGGFKQSLLAAVFLLVCYVLDNSDGEIARIKNLRSKFGDKYDTFVDWVVHAGFFAALGAAASRQTDEVVWLWLGAAAALGGSVNYFLSLIRDRHVQASLIEVAHENRSPEPDYDKPQGVRQWLVFVFRELFRADFCFIVLALALLDSLWVLLPAAAVGAQVYWTVAFSKSARNFHV